LAVRGHATARHGPVGADFAEGFDRVQACAAPGGAGASLLASVGFSVGRGTGRAGGRGRLVLPL